MVGWHEGYGPWSPRYEDGKLYGRGGADDGYAVYASLAALKALDAQGLPHARCVGVIETCEESGSYDLPAYLELLAPRMGDVDFVIGLDSGAGDYERLWLTTSLRGLVGGALSVEVLTEGVHSGDASGVVPSSFRIARKLLDRVEDSATGRVLPSAFHAPIPDERAAQARVASTILGEPMVRRFPWSGRTRPMVDDSPRSCSTARGARRCRSPAPTACRRSRTRATCCGRSRGSSCRSGCRRPSTARRPRTN
jgi:acetylornithine deacetylase/succinyl-diaminopimelate desuccinylase-like protein